MDRKETNKEELQKLFDEAAIDPTTSITLGLILRADFYEIKKIMDFIRANGMHLVIKKTSPGKLFICNEREYEVLE